MDFQFSEEQKMISNSAKDFAEHHIRPNIMKWDESQYFPREILEKAGEMGFMGIFIPEEYGGSGLGYHEYVSIIEEISKVETSPAVETKKQETSKAEPKKEEAEKKTESSPEKK